MADILISDTPEILADRVAVDFSALVAESVAQRDRFSIALAGGVTPRQFYERLAKEPYRTAIPWSKLWIFWGDERCVPKEHQDSNFRMAAEALLQFVPIPPSHVYRIRGEDPPPQAARDYEKNLREFFRDSGEWPGFDLILLGMGADGHTASLIPGTSAVSDYSAEATQEERRHAEGQEAGALKNRWVVNNVVRSLQTVRITLTLPAINQARHIWFLVTGAKKSATFAEVQKGANPAFPASLVKPVRGELKWYVDKAVLDAAGETAPIVVNKINRTAGGK